MSSKGRSLCPYLQSNPNSECLCSGSETDTANEDGQIIGSKEESTEYIYVSSDGEENPRKKTKLTGIL